MELVSNFYTSELCINWCFFLKSSIAFAVNTTIGFFLSFFFLCFFGGRGRSVFCCCCCCCCSLRFLKLLVGVAKSSSRCRLCCHMQLISWYILLFDFFGYINWKLNSTTLETASKYFGNINKYQQSCLHVHKF